MRDTAKAALSKVSSTLGFSPWSILRELFMHTQVQTPCEELSKLWKRGTDFLGSQYAILGGAMTWVSERKLVSALSNAGGFGVLACGSMPPDLFEKEIKGTQSLTKAPFGVNIITMHPHFETLLDIACSLKVSHIVLGGGLPPPGAIDRLKKEKVKLICFASAPPLAAKLIQRGVDALILEGMEAGGHVGPVSTTVLAQEILPCFGKTVPIFMAGGIGRGEAIVSFLKMGAAGCQLGTRFVCSTESQAHPAFKEVFIRAKSRNATVCSQLDSRFPVIPVRAIENKATQDFIRKQKELIHKVDAGHLDAAQAQLEIEHFWAGSLKKAVIDGDVESGSIMAGQSVGMVTQEEPLRDIFNDLIAQANSCFLGASPV